MINFKSVSQTIFFKKENAELLQLIKVNIINSSNNTNVILCAAIPDKKEQKFNLYVPSGESVHDVFLPEIIKRCPANFTILINNELQDSTKTYMDVKRKWVVHVLQVSHHDPGYTDLPSLVLREHDKHLDEAVNIAEMTKSYPDDAKFRIVIEQSWSIYHYIKNMPKDRVDKIIALMQNGQFELTAMFGNMTTELCGHETIIRSLYNSFEIKRDYNIPVIAAEHNDITGISWGLSQVLADTGIKIFCPNIPLYYNWGGNAKMLSFWNQRKIFGHEGPGAFWWEAPNGKRLLFWCNNGYNGNSYHTMPNLVESLMKFEDQGFPFSTMRWQVGGGARDNSPYIKGYSDTIKDWNEKWEFPRLISSTNAKFYDDLKKEDLSILPTWRGELPGQDYPVGATSTASATACNRSNHSSLPSAEKLASFASLFTDYRYPKQIIKEAYEETLWYDEHAWGFHFPCGPAMRASQYEKEIHAYRAESLSHGVLNKAMANLTDNISLGEGFHLVVFNTSSWDSTALVRTPMREMDNSGSEMKHISPEKDKQGIGYLKGYILGNRFHTILPPEFLEGNFDLVNTVTGNIVPYQITEITSPMEPIYYSGDRLGIGSGTKRYGFFEKPNGLKLDLCFIAKNVPAMGWLAYTLQPKDSKIRNNIIHKTHGTIKNEYFSIKVNSLGKITSIFDKVNKYELVDVKCRHSFFDVIVRNGNDINTVCEDFISVQIDEGTIISEIRIITKTYGHPVIEKSIILCKNLKRIFMSVKILKDPTPLLNAHISFPFAAQNPRFRYEGSISSMTPIQDYLPGSFSDTIAVQNWVKVKDGNLNILWCSLDAPIVEFSHLWPGYVSPAHRCIIDDDAVHSPQNENDLDTGWIFSQITQNNFGTNFSVSQCGELLFRYVMITEFGEVTDSEAAKFGQQSTAPLEQLFTDRACNSKNILPSGRFMEIDNKNIIILTVKKAEDDNGMILRLWNMSEATENVKITIFKLNNIQAVITNLCEEDVKQEVSCSDNIIELIIISKDIITLRIIS